MAAPPTATDQTLPHSNQAIAMTRSRTLIFNILRRLPRAAAIVLVLWGPLLAIHSVRADAHSTIEAPAPAKKGVGFVLLVSLQRGQNS
jgi:hypothetical protein